jgi:hypothetical protein
MIMPFTVVITLHLGRFHAPKLVENTCKDTPQTAKRRLSSRIFGR